ncbi:MAG TPA: hypothetical protein DCQ32_09325 [Cyanobacteria bacterium UBA8156]|nr:hypothetical protein [Cyanobacteria bacterium UBA8156]
MAVVVRAERQNPPGVVNEGAILAVARNLNTIALERVVTPPESIGAPLTVRFNLLGLSNSANGADFQVLVFNPSDILQVTPLATISGTDFLTTGVTIPANLTAVNLVPRAINDTLFEGGAGGTPEVLGLELVAATGYTIDTNILNQFVVGQITDNETPPTLSITTLPTTVAENIGNAAFVVSLSAASALDTSFTFTTTAGTATAGQDYTSVNQVVTIPAGQTSVTVNVPIANDTIDEPDQTFTVAISTPINATLGATTSGTVTITDDDAAPVVQINSPAAVNEGSPVVFTVSFAGPTTATELGAVTGVVNTADVSAVAGNDYTALVGTAFSIAQGSSSTTVSVTTSDDNLAEPAETFTATLSGLGGASATLGTATGTGTINASDTPTVTLSAGTPNPIPEGNAGTTNVTFTVTISNPSSTATTFTVAATGNGTNPATAGTDFGTPSSTSITFPANNTTAITFTVPVNGDTTPEPNETFGVTLTQTAGITVAGGSTLTQTVTIQDDDVSVSINTAASDLTAAEVGDTGFVRIERTGSTAAALPVNVIFGGTATNGTDYNLLVSPVTIPVGASFVDVPVTPIPDILTEGPETVSFTLQTGAGYGLGATTAAAVTIADLGSASSPGVLVRQTPTGTTALGTINNDTVVGSPLNDTIAAFAGDDVVVAGSGNDSVDGGLGNDLLFGGDGADTLIGSVGADTLFGGAGNDVFVLSSSSQGPDVIGDFATGDTIRVAAVGFGGGLVAGTLPADRFVLGAAATTATHRFVYNGTTGELFFDVDGTGATAPVLLATLTGAPALANTDILVG